MNTPNLHLVGLAARKLHTPLSPFQSKINFFTTKQTLLSVIFMTTLSFSSVFGQDLKPVARRVHEAYTNNRVFSDVSLFKPQPDAAQRFSKLCAEVTVADVAVNELKRVNTMPMSALRLKIPYKGENLTVDLVEVANLSDDFQMLTSESNGAPVKYAKGKYYRGILAGDDNSIATFSIFKNEVIGLVSIPQVGNIVVAKIDDAATEYVIYNDKDVKFTVPTDCHTDETHYTPFSTELRESPQALIAKCTKVYLETDYAMYVNKGSAANATNYITAIFNNAATIYENEEISIAVSTVFVWTTQDPYSTTTSSTALNQFASRRPTFNGNLAQLITLGGKGTGGVAWLDVLCNARYSYSYANVNATYENFPTYSWSVLVVTHEIGHNLGSPHTHSCTWTGGAIDNCATTEGGCAAGPTPVNGGTIMSYCHQKGGTNLSNGFGPLPGARIRDRVTRAACLPTSCTSVNNPPTVSISSPTNNATFTAPASITINVTAADVDGSITQVQFYNGTTLLVTDITSPYSFPWQNVAAGTYSLTAVATDNAGATTTSTAVAVTVNPAGATCADAYESNNNANQAKALTVGTAINAAIGSSNDNDYFRFSTTATAPKVRITLNTLPANYNLRLRIQGSNTVIGSSLNAGTTDEVISYNARTTATTYIVQVFGVSGAFSTAQCYSLLAETSNTNFLAPPSIGALVDATETLENGLALKLSPNPTSDNVQIAIETVEAGHYTLTLNDVVGKTLRTEKVQLEKGKNTLLLDLANYATGMYFIRLQDGAKYVTAKLVVK